MDIVEFQEKMDPTHRVSFCRMLKMEQLPEYVLEEYRRVKMLTDRIDSSVPVSNLAMIAISAGYDPDTGKFCVTEQPVDETAKLLEQDETAGPTESIDEAVDKPVKEAINEGVKQEVEQMTAQPAAQPVEGGKLWSLNMPVNVLQEDELLQGKIFAVHPDEPVQLTVALDSGENVMVNENEVEAI